MAKGSYGSSLSLIVAYHLRSFPPEWTAHNVHSTAERTSAEYSQKLNVHLGLATVSFSEG